jgi:sec-independent protein translocase protein TatC
MQENEIKEMGIIDHLRDLRKFLWHSVIGVAVGAAVVALNIKFVYDKIIFAPKNPDFITYKFFCKISDALCIKEIPINIINRQMAGQFSAHIWTSITFGIIIAFPYIIYELWKFIKPALYENEKKNGITFMIVSSTLFMIGILFGYFVITPLSINFLGNYFVTGEIVNNIDLSSYNSLVRTTVLANGVVFELPIIIYFLAKMGLVTDTFMKENRKYAVIIVLLLSAIITPPDIISQIIVAIPLSILYEISIYIAKITAKKPSDDKLVVS